MAERVSKAHGEPTRQLFPKDPSLWILEPCTEPLPIPGLTLEVEEVLVTVRTSTLVITASSLALSYFPA